MKEGLDVKHINPFLQSCVVIFENVVQQKLTVSKAAAGELEFDNTTFILQIGITGEMKGQVLITMTLDRAKEIASKMMCGMEVNEMDEMARSALGELCNMIMGNAATLFSTDGVLIDITPPMSLLGDKLVIQADVKALKVPLLADGQEYIDLFICVAK